MTLSLSDTLNRGIACLQANDSEKAEELFQAVLHLEPDNADALHLLGVLKLQQGKTESALELMYLAIEHCQKQLVMKPDDLPLTLLLAYIYMDMQQWSEAEPHYRRALKINPGLSEAYSGLGSIYFNQGNLTKAYSMYYQALKKDAENVEALYNQGIVLRGLGQLNEAEISLSRAVALAPGYTLALGSLGLTLQELKRPEDAKKVYQDVLKTDSENSFAKHMLAALQGSTTLTAPAAFVADLFDAYAPAYESHLLEKLEFKAPEALAELVKQSCQDALPFAEVIDLGCGTGLMADTLKGSYTHIDGVDLSQKMLLLASSKKHYRALTLNDIQTFLHESQQQYSCCLASDVFIYIGDLLAVFSAVYESLDKGGVFAFTTEDYAEGAATENAYILRESGRYAHSLSYITQLANATKFVISQQESLKLRKEEDIWLSGRVYILRKK